MDQQKIGQYILQLRKQQNLTQKQLADKLNVTAQAVSKWENGRGVPDIEILQKISLEFNVNIDSILKGEEAEKKRSKKYIIILIVVFAIISILGIILSMIKVSKDYNFSDIKSKNEEFNVKGVAVYSSKKNSIYISDIEYLTGKDEKKYIGMECILYESHNNLEEKISQCGSIKKNEKNELKTLKELLQETEFKVENFSCTNKSIKKSDLYISINALDAENKIITYKIPLKLSGSCN